MGCFFTTDYMDLINYFNLCNLWWIYLILF